MSRDKPEGMTRRHMLAASLPAAGIVAIGATPAMAQQATREGLKGKRVLVCIGDFSEDLETYYIAYRLMEEGIVPVVAAAEVKRLQMVVHDFDPRHSNYIEMTGHCIQTDVAYKDVKPGEYDGLLIPGGRGPEEIRQDADALRIVGHFFDRNLPLGAMCHGPQVIYAARPVKGRRIAAYCGIRVDVERAGGVYVDEPVVVDQRMVTSRGWPDLPYFMPKFLRVLAGE